MDAPAARREDADAPVAELVADALDDDRRRVGDRARGGELIAQILEQDLGGIRVEIVFARQPLDGGGRRHPQQVARQLADREPELQRPARAIAFPERHLARLARSRGDEDAVVRDLLDAPRRSAEDERFADPAFEDHLLVELADARGARYRTVGARQKDAVQAAIRNRSAVGDRDALRAFARADAAGRAIPRDARPQLREFVRRIPSRQHVEHTIEHCTAQLRERRGAADRGEEIVHVPVVHRRHRDDVLRENVEGIPREAARLDVAVVHRLRDGRGRDEVAAKLRKDDAFAHGVRPMSRAADALQSAGNRRRRFDLDDEVDRAHVDAELQR